MNTVAELLKEATQGNEALASHVQVHVKDAALTLRESHYLTVCTIIGILMARLEQHEMDWHELA